jgi:hypothetical protein
LGTSGFPGSCSRLPSRSAWRVVGCRGWLVPAEQTARPSLRKCRSWFHQSGLIQLLPPTPGAPLPRFLSPLGARCGVGAQQQHAAVMGSEHLTASKTTLFGPEEWRTCFARDRTGQGLTAPSAPPDLLCVGWTWQPWGLASTLVSLHDPQRPTARNSTCKQDHAHRWPVSVPLIRPHPGRPAILGRGPVQ